METSDRIAYLAGFIDGEGCIRIGKGHTHKSGKRIFYLSLSVHQVDRRPLDILYGRYGGSLRMNTAHKPNNLWAWTVSGTTAARAIEEMLPYLITKKEQAILGLEFQARKSKRGRGAGFQTTVEELEFQETMFEQMRQLKHIPAEAYITSEAA